MSYLRGPARSEVHLLPPCVDDYVPPNAPVRFIDAFVEGLDFPALGFTHAQPATTGRPPYHPADLLKLYIYGYLYRIRSSRRLEAEAARNLEVVWLLRGLRPDFKTIANFRRDNRAAFKPLLKQFNLLCRRLDLFGAELVAVDGSKFKAVNNSRGYYTQEQLQELLQKVEARIEEYLSELDCQDTEAEGVAGAPTRQELAEKIAHLEQRRGRYEELLGQLQAQNQTAVALTDPDSRKMKGPHGYMVGYNVQLAVDAKHDLIVAETVVQAANDLGQLSRLGTAAKAELQVEHLQVVADKGYHAADQLEACEQAQVETFVPEQGTTSGRGKDGRKIFPKEQFIYDAQADAYQCPAGQRLPRVTQTRARGLERIFYYNRVACRGCALRAQCTSSACRVLLRRPNEAVVERAAQRVEDRPDLVARRKEIVEHVFGSLRQWGHDTFLMCGLEKVRAEFSLSALVYNLRRVLNLIRVEDLLKAV
jgi:transposase